MTWFPRSIRARVTTLAAVVTAIPLLLGVLVIANLLQRSLTANTEQAAERTARTVAAEVARSGPSGLPAVTSGISGGTTVHVVGQDHRVAAQYPRDSEWDGTVVYREGVLVRGDKHYWLPGDLYDHLTVQTSVHHAGRLWWVVVQTSQEAQHEAVSQTAQVVLISIPFLVGGATALAWVLTGRTLRPVEDIRRRAEHITAQNLDERLPVGELHDEVATLASTMNQMLHRLHSSQESQRRFVADASHELRSPVATLQAALEIAQHRQQPVSIQHATLMRRETDRLQELIDGLLLLTRSDNTGLVLHQQEIDLDDLVRHHVVRLRSTTHLVVHSTRIPVRMIGDHEKLDRVVRNLTDNAVRHAPSWIRVDTSSTGTHALLSVSDDGTGVPSADRERIFERFVRLDDSRTREAGGSGLGLAIVREIVHAHKGTVQVRSSERGGAQFDVLLPLRPVGENTDSS